MSEATAPFRHRGENNVCLAFCKTACAIANGLLSYSRAAGREIAIRQPQKHCLAAVARNVHSAGAAFARCVGEHREMTPRILIVDHPAPLPALRRGGLGTVVHIAQARR